jgi:hypothetical protein
MQLCYAYHIKVEEAINPLSHLQQPTGQPSAPPATLHFNQFQCMTQL